VGPGLWGRGVHSRIDELSRSMGRLWCLLAFLRAPGAQHLESARAWHSSSLHFWPACEGKNGPADPGGSRESAGSLPNYGPSGAMWSRVAVLLDGRVAMGSGCPC
jgi:hypothetical protein